MNICSRSNTRTAGLAYLGTAAAFAAVSVTQPAFIGVACAFAGLAIVMLLRRGA